MRIDKSADTGSTCAAKQDGGGTADGPANPATTGFPRLRPGQMITIRAIDGKTYCGIFGSSTTTHIAITDGPLFHVIPFTGMDTMSIAA